MKQTEFNQQLEMSHADSALSQSGNKAAASVGTVASAPLKETKGIAIAVTVVVVIIAAIAYYFASRADKTAARSEDPDKEREQEMVDEKSSTIDPHHKKYGKMWGTNTLINDAGSDIRSLLNVVDLKAKRDASSVTVVPILDYDGRVRVLYGPTQMQEYKIQSAGSKWVIGYIKLAQPLTIKCAMQRDIKVTQLVRVWKSDMKTIVLNPYLDYKANKIDEVAEMAKMFNELASAATVSDTTTWTSFDSLGKSKYGNRYSKFRPTFTFWFDTAKLQDIYDIGSTGHVADNYPDVFFSEDDRYRNLLTSGLMPYVRIKYDPSNYKARGFDIWYPVLYYDYGDVVHQYRNIDPQIYMNADSPTPKHFKAYSIPDPVAYGRQIITDISRGGWADAWISILALVGPKYADIETFVKQHNSRAWRVREDGRSMYNDDGTKKPIEPKVVLSGSIDVSSKSSALSALIGKAAAPTAGITAEPSAWLLDAIKSPIINK